MEDRFCKEEDGVGVVVVCRIAEERVRRGEMVGGEVRVRCFVLVSCQELEDGFLEGFGDGARERSGWG